MKHLLQPIGHFWKLTGHKWPGPFLMTAGGLAISIRSGNLILMIISSVFLAIIFFAMGYFYAQLRMIQQRLEENKRIQEKLKAESRIYTR